MIKYQKKENKKMTEDPRPGPESIFKLKIVDREAQEISPREVAVTSFIQEATEEEAEEIMALVADGLHAFADEREAEEVAKTQHVALASRTGEEGALARFVGEKGLLAQHEGDLLGLGIASRVPSFYPTQRGLLYFLGCRIALKRPELLAHLGVELEPAAAERFGLTQEVETWLPIGQAASRVFPVVARARYKDSLLPEQTLAGAMEMAAAIFFATRQKQEPQEQKWQRECQDLELSPEDVERLALVQPEKPKEWGELQAMAQKIASPPIIKDGPQRPDYIFRLSLRSLTPGATQIEGFPPFKLDDSPAGFSLTDSRRPDPDVVGLLGQPPPPSAMANKEERDAAYQQARRAMTRAEIIVLAGLSQEGRGNSLLVSRLFWPVARTLETNPEHLRSCLDYYLRFLSHYQSQEFPDLNQGKVQSSFMTHIRDKTPENFAQIMHGLEELIEGFEADGNPRLFGLITALNQQRNRTDIAMGSPVPNTQAAISLVNRLLTDARERQSLHLEEADLWERITLPKKRTGMGAARRYLEKRLGARRLGI